MARWTGNPETPSVLAAAEAWRERCVADDGSILSEQRLWTPDNLEALRGRFRENPILGADRGFYDKLREQLEHVPLEPIRESASPTRA